MPPVKLYRHPLSGHSHRVQLALSILGVPAELVDVDIFAGAHKTPAFLAMNAFGQLPVLDDDGVLLADSNAILVYLVRRYAPDSGWLPADPRAEAEVYRWFSVAAGQLAFGPSAARVSVLLRKQRPSEEVTARTTALLGVLDGHLTTREWLVPDRPTLADLSLYTYVSLAPEGLVPLDPYPHVRAWLARVEALPGFVPMVRTPVELPA